MSKLANIIVTIEFILIGTLSVYLIYNYERQINNYEQQIEKVEQELEIKNIQLKSFNINIENLKDIIYKYSLRYRWNVTLSAYTTAKGETNNDNGSTAIMEKPIPGWSVAVSRDLKMLLGKRIYIEGFGVRYVNDLMNSRFKYCVDLLVSSKKYAINKIGKRQNIEIVLIEPFK